ncbi:hypothetical protein QTG54_009002 [Skeletonema marinoi]|uniref:Uncharacterized protein n=1 Tax=Skeletonema marinoi TaxID=267567 RepID=A0AAD9DAE3_9STRA|nr:hypothetical protein QTG54_009002 [Skeletonema marinoi]
MNRLEGIQLFSKWKKVNLLGMKRICNRGSLPVQMRIRTRAYQHQSETHLGLFSKHTYLVEEEEEEIDDTLAQAAGATVPLVTPGVHGTVHEATPLEPTKQRRIKVLLVIFCVLITALAVGLGIPLSRLPVPADNSSEPPVVLTSSPSMSLPPSPSPTERSYACFADRDKLKLTIDRYVQLGCNEGAAFCPASIVEKYGWPMGSWCVDDVTNMASLF